MRFLPDLAAIAVALYLSRAWMWRVPVAILLVAGFIVILLQAAHLDVGFRLLLVGGIAFAWAAAVIVGSALRFAARQIPMMPERRELLAGVAMAAPAVLLGYGTFIGRRRFHLNEVDLAVPGLDPALDGLRIAQLSDIHLSPFLSRADLRWCVEMANQARPHLAVVTGDLITGIRDSIDDCLDELRRLRSDAGVFGCTGNHELYIEAEAYTAREAERRGMNFLRQQQTTLRFGGAALNLAGVDHQGDKPSHLRGAAALLRPGELNLLLSHNPAVFPVAAAQDWDVTLSGHMHGGQINLELANANFNVARFATPYVYGTYRERRSAIYVTRGIGTIGMPVRLGVPPEVALIRLRPLPPIL